MWYVHACVHTCKCVQYMYLSTCRRTSCLWRRTRVCARAGRTLPRSQTQLHTLFLHSLHPHHRHHCPHRPPPPTHTSGRCRPGAGRRWRRRRRRRRSGPSTSDREGARPSPSHSPPHPTASGRSGGRGTARGK